MRQRQAQNMGLQLTAMQKDDLEWCCFRESGWHPQMQQRKGIL